MKKISNKTLSNIGDKNLGIILIHGFTSTTKSMSYPFDFFAKNGIHVEAPSLSGHGSTWQEMNKVSYQEWMSDVKKSIKKLSNRTDNIFLFGLSMGGTLALLNSLEKEISGVIAINNACIFKDFRLLFLPFLKYFLLSLPAVASDIKDNSETEIAYDKTPSFALHELLKLAKLLKNNLHKIKKPVLLFKSIDDHVIPLISSVYTFDNIGSSDKQLIYLKNSFHVATQDFDRNVIFQKSLEFIRKESTKKMLYP